MPSTSAKQAKFMKAVANNPKFAKKVGVAQSVGKDFEMADKKMKKFGDGGVAKKPKPPMPREPITGGPDTVPLTPERKKFLEELRRRQGEGAKPPKKPGMKSGGKVKKFNLGGPAAPAPAATSGTAALTPAAQTKRPLGTMATNLTKTPTLSSTPANAPTSTAPRTFDRNAAYKAFNARAGELAKQGVSSKAIAQQQAILRKLQMNNSSTPQQHRQAFDAALAALKPTAPFPGNTLGALKSMAPQYAKGGKVMKKSDKKGGEVMKKSDKAGRALVKKSADTMGRAMMKKAGGGKCYAKGGSVSSRADGVAKKGKTHTKMVTMRKGGSC